jgi:hypothetical protein
MLPRLRSVRWVGAVGSLAIDDRAISGSPKLSGPGEMPDWSGLRDAELERSP